MEIATPLLPIRRQLGVELRELLICPKGYCLDSFKGAASCGGHALSSTAPGRLQSKTA
jgi:hypothetical protein